MDTLRVCSKLSFNFSYKSQLGDIYIYIYDLALGDKLKFRGSCFRELYLYISGIEDSKFEKILVVLLRGSYLVLHFYMIWPVLSVQ